MLTREKIESVLRQLNAAENSRPHSTVEETSARIDAVMSPDVHGWRNGVFVPNRAAERESERMGFGALEDYHRDFDQMVIEPPLGSIGWTIRGTFRGRKIVAAGGSIFEFGDDGLIRRYWMYVDPAAFAYRAEYAASLAK